MRTEDQIRFEQAAEKRPHRRFPKTSSKARPASLPEIKFSRRLVSSARISSSVRGSPSRLWINNFASSARSFGDSESASSASAVSRSGIKTKIACLLGECNGSYYWLLWLRNPPSVPYHPGALRNQSQSSIHSHARFHLAEGERDMVHDQSQVAHALFLDKKNLFLQPQLAAQPDAAA